MFLDLTISKPAKNVPFILARINFPVKFYGQKYSDPFAKCPTRLRASHGVKKTAIVLIKPDHKYPVRLPAPGKSVP